MGRHTIVRIEDGFKIVHEHRLVDSIAQFKNIDEASHFCNRLNGGQSGELAACVLMLKQMRAEERAKEKANG